MAIFQLDLPNQAQLTLWAQVIWVWCLANYADPRGPVGRQEDSGLDPTDRRHYLVRVAVRSVVSAGVVLFMGGVATALIALGFLLLLPLVRVWLNRHEQFYAYAAEWEVLVNILFLVFSGSGIALAGATLSHSVVRLPASREELTALFLLLSAIVFVLRGGTYVTRGVLDKAGAFPRKGERSPRNAGTEAQEVTGVDTTEYNRGRTIGNIERLLLLLVVIVGSYEALGFLVAAKGLIRASEFEDRDFAEYFIVGSLTSVLVALLLGLALRYALMRLGLEIQV